VKTINATWRDGQVREAADSVRPGIRVDRNILAGSNSNRAN
jgi:hypothetical protein